MNMKKFKHEELYKKLFKEFDVVTCDNFGSKNCKLIRNSNNLNDSELIYIEFIPASKRYLYTVYVDLVDFENEKALEIYNFILDFYKNYQIDKTFMLEDRYNNISTFINNKVVAQ